MTDWQPPGGTPPPAAPRPAALPPTGWGQPYGAPPAPTLPWYRSTGFLVLGGLGLLLLGGVAGVLLTFLGLGAATVGGAFDVDVTTYGERGDLTAFAIGAGQCAAEGLSEAQGYEEGATVPCEGPHAIEHYATVEPPTLGGRGGRVARGDLAAFADSACYLAFEPYVGVVYTDSEYEYDAIVPSEPAWNGGTRTVHCVLTSYDGTSSGSANGSRR